MVSDNMFRGTISKKRRPLRLGGVVVNLSKKAHSTQSASHSTSLISLWVRSRLCTSIVVSALV